MSSLKKKKSYSTINKQTSFTHLLSKEYLKDYEVDFVSSEEVKPIKTDLLISDYCISELDEKGWDFYLNQIDAKYIYFTCNALGDRKDKLIERVKQQYDVEVVDEHPKTTKHPNFIIYGVANNNL